MFFSIIVPIYRVQEYLHQCIQSILSQSFKDFELILVDDGSPDQCPAICDAYALEDARVKVIHKENGGLVSARKTGISQAKGDYVLNVDGDDYIAANLLQYLHSELSAQNYPDLAAFGYTTFGCQDQTTAKNLFPAGLYQGDSLKEVQNTLVYNVNHPEGAGMIHSIWSKAVRRELLLPLQLSVPNEITKGEDLAVTAPLIAGCKTMLILDNCGYYYRISQTSMTKKWDNTDFSRLKRLVNHLDKALGPEYTENINIYILFAFYSHIVHAAASFANCRSYVRTMAKNMDAEIQKRIRMVKTKSLSRRMHFISLLMKHRLYGSVWFLYIMKHRR